MRMAGSSHQDLSSSYLLAARDTAGIGKVAGFGSGKRAGASSADVAGLMTGALAPGCRIAALRCGISPGCLSCPGIECVSLLQDSCSLSPRRPAGCLVNPPQVNASQLKQNARRSNA